MNRISALFSSSANRPYMEIRFGLALLALLLVTLLAYWPGLTGPFVLDDYSNLSPVGNNGGVHSWENFLRFVFGNDSGPTGRPVAMLSFLIDMQDWPPNIAALKYTNIQIHLLTGVVLCWFAYWMLQALQVEQKRAAWLALLLAAIWLVHPLNSTTTQYIVQRMTQLMTLFALLSLGFYIRGRLLVTQNQARSVLYLVLALFPFGLLSVLSKENGAMLLLLIVLIEYCVFPDRARSPLFRWWYRLGVLLPLSIMLVYLLLTLPASLEGYAYRHFSLVERLLTESRILCRYLALILFPSTLGVGLYHDDIVVSTSVLQPLTTLLSLLALLALAGAAVRWRKAHPMLLFGVGWFFALQLLESTYLPLELYFEHRNYMAMIGPLLTVVWYFNVLISRTHKTAVRRLAQFSVAMLFVFMSLSIWQNALLWGNTGELLAYWVFEKPESSRAKIAYAGFLVVNNNPQAAIEMLQQAQTLHPNEVTLMLHTWSTACAAGLESPITLEEIASRDVLEYKHNDMTFHLQELLEVSFSNACTPPPGETYVRLFDRVGQLPMTPDRRASYHFLYGDLNIALRQLDGALIQLSRAFQLHPVPDIPYRQALISASAGNYADSLVFLDRARQADARRAPWLPSSAPLFDRMETDIREILNTNN